MLRMIFRSPWYVHAALAAAVGAFGLYSYSIGVDMEREKALALVSPQPQAIDFDSFDPTRDIHAADEVHLIARLEAENSVRLTKERKGVDTVRYLFFLNGIDDPADTRDMRGALIMDSAQYDKFDAFLDENTIAFDEMSSIISLSGEAGTYVTLSGMVTDYMKDEGLTKANGFVFVEPWFDGREVALKPGDGHAVLMWLALGLSGVLCLVSFVKFRGGKRAKLAAQAPAE